MWGLQPRAYLIHEGAGRSYLAMLGPSIGPRGVAGSPPFSPRVLRNVGPAHPVGWLVGPRGAEKNF